MAVAMDVALALTVVVAVTAVAAVAISIPRENHVLQVEAPVSGPVSALC